MNVKLDAPTDHEDSAAVCLGADFVELSLLASQPRMSRTELQHILERSLSTNNDEDAPTLAEDIWEHLDDRLERLNKAYPFDFDETGFIMRRKKGRSHLRECYKFLLLMSNSDMSAGHRKLAGHDPTMLFERVCRYAVASYFAPEAAPSDCSVVLGTSRSGEHPKKKFLDLLEQFLAAVGTVDKRRDNEPAPNGGDGGIDIACWKRARKDLPGAACIFAQCKSGKHWHNDLHTSTTPANFLNRFTTGLTDCPEPISAYMTPTCISHTDWHGFARRGRHLLFDRVRIARFAHRSVPQGLLRECKQWTSKALEKRG